MNSMIYHLPSTIFRWKATEWIPVKKPEESGDRSQQGSIDGKKQRICVFDST